jgi:hypothetical protein
LKKLQTEQSEAEKAAKELEKAEKSLNKTKSKPKEKLKPNEVELAESKLKAAKEKAMKEEKDVKLATEEFNKNKLETMQNVLKKIVDIEKSYHEKILLSIEKLKEKAEIIKIEEESKLK